MRGGKSWVVHHARPLGIQLRGVPLSTKLTRGGADKLGWAKKNTGGGLGLAKKERACSFIYVSKSKTGAAWVRNKLFTFGPGKKGD